MPLWLYVFNQFCFVEGYLAIVNDGEEAAHQPASRVAHSDGNDLIADPGHCKQIDLTERYKGA